MKSTINETELRTIIQDWQTRHVAQNIRDRKLVIASAYAYLLGAYLSDGYLHWPKVGSSAPPHPQWSGLRDKYFADCISVALHTIGSPHSLRVYDRPMRQWNARPKSYSVSEKAEGKLGWWFDDVAPDKSYLPDIPRELVRPLVAGLMDGDGGIHRTPKNTYRLHYTGKEGFVEDFFGLLEGLEIRIYDTRYHLKGHVGLNIESFLKAGLCFAMYRKQRHLVGWCRKNITNAKDRGWKADLRKADVAKWYLKNANHLKAGWSPASERIPTGHITYQEESNER